MEAALRDSRDLRDPEQIGLRLFTLRDGDRRSPAHVLADRLDRGGQVPSYLEARPEDVFPNLHTPGERVARAALLAADEEPLDLAVAMCPNCGNAIEECRCESSAGAGRSTV